MTRKFLVPLLLPADPANALEAATKQYVDAHSGTGIGNVFPFMYNTSTLEAGIGTNQIRGNNATFTASTKLWVSEITVDGLDVSVGLGRIKANFQVYVQDYTSSARYALFNCTADSVDKGAYWELTVALVNSAGTIPGGKVAMQSLSTAQTSTLFSTTTAAPGLAPGSNGGGAGVYLDGSGAWSAPAGGGGGSAPTGTKLSALTALGSGAATGDLIEVVDISDTTMAASGTNKKLLLSELVTWLNANGVMVADDSITNAKLANAPANSLKGNNTGSSADPIDLTATQTLTMLSAGGTGNWHRYTFSTTTTTPPATNSIRFNNATLASVTAIYVNYTAIDIDVKTRLLTHGAGERFYVQGVPNSANNAVYRLTAAPTDNSTYATLTVVFESSGGSFANNADLMAGFAIEPKVISINAQVGTTYTLAWTDIYKLVTLNNAGAITLTVPTNATTAFPIGATIDLAQLGAGKVTVGGAGVTINATPSLGFRAQYSAATLIKYATDTWLLVGDLA